MGADAIRLQALALAALPSYLPAMDEDKEVKALRWRATHRGTREADMLIGGFFEARHREWSAGERQWFADLLEEQDVDIMAWAIGTKPVPQRFEGPLLEAMRKLDYVQVAR